MHRFTSKLGLLLLPALLVFAACDSHDHDHDDHFGTVERVELRERGSNNLFATWIAGANDNQFDGDLHLHPGNETAVNVLFFDAAGNQAMLGSNREYAVGVRLATAQEDGMVGQPGIVEFSAHGDHVDVEAVAEGQTYLVFQLLHGSHSDLDTPPVLVEVDDHD